MELSPIPFPTLVRRMRREIETADSIFDLPAKKWYRPAGELDFSANHFDRPVATPVGPAAGPHTQMAQNLVLSWLAGARILELKTVQINDRLELPRPCIHAPNVGFNVEWSQELRVEESAREYAKGVFLIEILKATRGFGRFEATGTSAFDTVYDLSVGYDLEGIRSAKVKGFLDVMKDSRQLFDELRAELDEHPDLRDLRDLELPGQISNCITLSTFHGCPADEIEAICRHLIEDHGLHTLVKLNPTLLGYETVEELLLGRLGYTHLELDPHAFDVDLKYHDGLEILRRLRRVAEKNGSIIGAKFTNTLVVKNSSEIFPTQKDEYMYLSGAPLHVLSMTLMQRFRDDLGFEMPTSFSAGIDARNFPTAAACGLMPITTCTDLLRQGGYARLPGYLRALGKEMASAGVTSREAFVLAARGHGGAAVRTSLERLDGGAALWTAHGERLERLAGESPDELPAALRALAHEAGVDAEALVLDATRTAGRLNGRDIVPGLADEPRYRAEKNAKPPRRIDSTLELYDCINCDLCISACPNDAVFAYAALPVDTATELLRLAPGADLERLPGRGFKIAETHQLAVVEAACNACSNCEVYCPEEGAPFLLKEQLFTHTAAFEETSADGFLRVDGALRARLEGQELRLEPRPEHNRAILTDTAGRFRLELAWDSLTVEGGGMTASGEAAGEADLEIDTALLFRMKTVWERILNGETVNLLNAEVPAAEGTP